MRLGLKLYPIHVVISLPLRIKITMIQLLLLFLCKFCSFFSYTGGALVNKQPTFFHCYWLIYFGYLAYHNTQRAFVIIYLICNDLLNCFRSLCNLPVNQSINQSINQSVDQSTQSTNQTISQSINQSIS